jgi:hexameric tyrosine-coordinated heme protein (HTHP)
MKTIFSSTLIALMLLFSPYSIADDHAKSKDYMPSLITETPLEGRNLAITIVRKTVGTIQKDGKAKHRVRDLYAEDPELLMRAVELVNLEFKIIAKANNYWREEDDD